MEPSTTGIYIITRSLFFFFYFKKMLKLKRGVIRHGSQLKLYIELRFIMPVALYISYSTALFHQFVIKFTRLEQLSKTVTQEGRVSSVASVLEQYNGIVFTSSNRSIRQSFDFQRNSHNVGQMSARCYCFICFSAR